MAIGERPRKLVVLDDERTSRRAPPIDAHGRAKPALAPTPARAERRAEPTTRRRRISPLTRRFLILNSLALVILVAGLLYLDDYRRSLIAAEFNALTTQGQIIAAALGEAATDSPLSEARESDDPPVDPTRGEPSRADGAPVEIADRLSPELARQILRRLAEPTRFRARLYALNGELIADTRVLGRYGGAVEVSLLPPPDEPADPLTRAANAIYDFVIDLLPKSEELPPYRERALPQAADYEETQAALAGETARALRVAADEQLVLSVAVPVQRFKRVLGALQLSASGRTIEQNLRSVRLDIIKLFAIALAVTFLVSLYLAGTIARPLRRLARAAERVRRGHGLGGGRGGAGQPLIPDMSRRNDEIGDLSGALNEMTHALWQRLDAIERFAADVAHEIKNPLTSLKSAVETAARIKDLEQQRRLMAIIVDDVARLDRLISDISGASRLDAELSRGESEPVDIARLLAALVDVHAATGGSDGPRLILDIAEDRPLIVRGIEDRLGQVFRNLIANAVSFSPPGGAIRIHARRNKNNAEIVVEDDGPGIPDDKLEAIFDRFYSERPKGEKFGTHSGLGLSISRQIVNAHGGRIWAENRRTAGDEVEGARFVIRLPVE
ncbi:MAG TPA: stimulus-sensing domain-containing protein [Alphaproteobacteria bacterium]|nr:stimulus-sensing domain-containing protein [Alphaproteobacteria bacterium]